MAKGFWEWIFEDEEVFIDQGRGIFYRGSGNTRSVKGLFKNFDLAIQKEESQNNELKRFIQKMIEKGKITKDDLLEYSK